MPSTTYGRPVRAGDVSFRRAMTMVFMSLVLPGSAQLASGHRRAGRLILRVFMALVALVVVLGLVFLVSRSTLLSIAVRPTWLTVIRWGVLSVGLAWAAVVVHAYLLARPPTIESSRRLVATVTTIAVCVVILGPALLLSNIARSQEDFLAMFPDTGVTSLPDRVNVLLLGGDAGDDRIGLRPDSINIASVDTRSGRGVLFGLPRNMEHVPFPDGSALSQQFPDGFWCEDDECLLNGVYTYAVEHPELFEPGMTDLERGTFAMKQAVGATLGLDIDYYAMVDLGGFEGIVDALGGIQIDVQSEVPIGGNADDPDAPVEGYIEPGVQTLDGHEALWYARSRTGSDDYVRMQRQRCVLGAILNEADPATVVRNYQDLTRSAATTISTDVPQGTLDDFVLVGLKTKSEPLTSVQFVPPLIPNTADPDFTLIRATVASAIAASEDAPVTEAPDTQAPPPSDDGSGSSSGGSSDGGGSGGSDPETPAAPVTVDEVCSYG